MRSLELGDLTTVSLLDRILPNETIQRKSDRQGVYADVATVMRRLSDCDPPVLCFCPDIARETYRCFARTFPGLTTFAVKSAPHPDLIEMLAEAGMVAFDVASPAEMTLVRTAAPEAALNYNNPIKSDSELACAVDQFGVQHTTIDDLVGLKQVKRLIKQREGFVVAVRVAPQDNDALHDFRSKFGCDAAAAVNLLKAVSAAGFAPGISFHPGSQCTSAGAYTRMIELCQEIVSDAGVQIATLNVGGGFPAPYLGSGASALPQFLSEIRNALLQHFPRRVQFICEPGRAIAAPSFTLLTRVKHHRSNGDLYINDGLYGGLMELSQIPIRLPVRAWRDGRVLKGPRVPHRVFGPTCDPLDVLPERIELARDVKVGDWIEFQLAGAYCTATSTRFNGFGNHTIVEVDALYY